MNQDIIRIAREAGFEAPSIDQQVKFERFFHMAQADMKEKCAKVCDAEFWAATRRDGAIAGVAAGNCAAAIRAIGDSHDQT